MLDPGGDFASVLARARGGDRAALDQLAREYEPKLRLVARVLLGPALRPYLDSVDLVQSVHKSLLLGLRRQHVEISIPEMRIALALTIVRRKVARHWRHLQRQQRLEGRQARDTNVADLLTSLSNPRDDPGQAAEFRDAVEHLFRQLAPSERRLLELRLQGYSTAEIARTLGLQPNALRVQLHRLRQRLRAGGVLTDWL